MSCNDDKKDPIADSLGLTPMSFDEPPVAKPPAPVVIEHASDDEERANKDYQYARENFYNVIETGTKALEDMLDVAKASEHPRAYEVVSTIMKTLVDANKDLVAMSEKKAGPKKADAPAGDGTVNNNLFVGSTAELQAMLKDLKND
jgi:hypothetical protein